MFKRILVPVDGSKHAERALARAVEIQKLCNAELTLLTVYRHHSLLESSLSMVRPTEPQLMDDVMREHAEGVVNEAKTFALTKGSTGPRAFVKNGPVARQIASFAEDHDIDLIVIGKRGNGSFEDYLLGSVSHKVAGIARCAVLTV